MIKKSICIFLILLMSISMTVSASYMQNAEFTSDLRIKISGRVENGAGEKVSVMILRPGTDLSVFSDSATAADLLSLVDYYREVTAESDGSFGLEVLFDDKAKGYRDIKISALGVNELYQDAVYVVKESDITDFISYMNSISASDAELENYLLSNLPIIAEEESEYADTPAIRGGVASLVADARKEMFNNEFKLLSDVKSAFNMALLVAKINASSTEKSIEDAINDYSVSSTLSQKCYMTYFDSYKSQALKALKDGKPFSVKAFDESLGESLVLSAIKNVSNHNAVTQIINNSNSFLKLDLKKYNSLADKSSVNKAVIKKTDSLSGFKAEFTSRVDEAYKSKNSQSSSPSSSGASSGSASVAGNVSFDIATQTQTVPKEYFSDLEDVVWAKESINSLASLGIVSGVGGGKFEPARYVTREEFVKMIVGAFTQLNTDARLHFEDVNESDWCYSFVATAFEKGYINGVTDSTFGMGQNIKRQDASLILARILGGGASASAGFADSSDISEYAVNAVNLMWEKGIINGNENNMFLPHNSLTRAECAKMIYALYEKTSEVK